MPHSDLDYYKILGVTRHATDDEIKKAFRKLARDTHPDKNPNDPTAKDRFQELQRAYDTLKDALERSKYDEDNQTHGYAGGYSSAAAGASATPRGARSTTAKRYTTGGGAHTPAWATGGATYTDGFTARAAAGARTRAPAPDPYGYADYGGTRRTARGSYAYADYAREYEDMYTPRRESAYKTTRNTPASAPRPKSTAGQHSSTSARYSSTTGATPAQGPEFDLSSYIREKRMKEEEEKRRKEREATSKEERRKRDKEDELRREKERAREETRRAEEDSSRAKYGANDSYFGYGTAPGAYPQDEELEKQAEERMKDSQDHRKSRHSTQYPPGTAKKKSSAKPTSSSWNYPQGDDVHVYEARPEDDSDKSDAMPSKPDYFRMPRAEYVPSGQRVWEPNFDFSDNVTERHKDKGRDSAHSSRKKDASPMRNHHNSNVHHATPPDSPGTAQRKKRPSPHRTKSSGSTSKKSEDGNVRFSSDPFVYQEPPTDNERDQPKSSAASTPSLHPFDFNGFSRSSSNRNFFNSGAFTSANSPEPEKQAESPADQGPPSRPKSQPSVTSPKENQSFNFNLPFGKPPPKKTTPTPFKKELYENLLNTPAPYEFQVSDSTTSPKKKRSVPTLGKSKARNRDRRASLDGYRNLQVDSDSEDDGPKPPRPFSAAPGSMNLNGPPPALRPDKPSIIPDFGGPEPMDITPDDNAEPSKGSPATSFASGTAKPRSTRGSNIDLSSLSSAPPLAPEPGLSGFANDLKSTLPFESRASSGHPLGRTASNSSSNSARARMPPPPVPNNNSTTFTQPSSSFWDEFPQTPFEDPPLTIPTPPKVVKIPNTVSLPAYNQTYDALGRYFAEWQAYENKVAQLRSLLMDQHTIQLQKAPGDGDTPWLSPNADEITKYLTRVRERDMVVDESFRRARKEHVKGLQAWMTLREQVIHMERPNATSSAAAAAGYRGPTPVGYKR